MMEDNLFRRNLYIFMSVAQEGSFSAAARKLHMTQASVSQQIDKLESSLRFKLFDRTAYRPVLTETGIYFYEKCVKLDSLYRKITQTARSKSESSGSLLRIGITGPIEQKYLPDIIQTYHTLFPQIRTDIRLCTFMEGVAGLEQNILDTAFGLTNDFRNRKTLLYFPLFRCTINVICSKRHQFAGKQNITGKELADQPIIPLFGFSDAAFFNDYLKSFEKDGVKPDIVRKADNLEELILAVKLDQGIALLAPEVIPEDPELCSIPVTGSHHHADFCIGINKNNKKPYLLPFVKQVQTYFASLKV
jgi:DNA-binding transcriptional LysR family regulator